MSKPPLFERITIIGLGLIGSSIARAAHEKNLAGHITGCDENEISLAYGRKHGFIDEAMRDAATAVADSNLVILATPPSTLGNIAAAIAPKLMPGAIVMDTCSVKQAAIAAIAPHMPEGVDFIPAHPIAGSEHGGVSAGKANLFEKKRVVVTPETPRADTAMQTINMFWRGMGARVEAMPPHLHDMVYAYVSHLPQLLAFAAEAPLAAHAEDKDATLQKFLRLTGSNKAMWAEIFSLNNQNVLAALDRYLDALHHITKELKNAPEGTVSEADKTLALTALFPRIAASCVITTIMEAEKKAGFPFARYVGTGFADFTSPAAQPPEEDIERISNQYAVVSPVLEEYISNLTNIRKAVEKGDVKKIGKALS